MTAPGGHQALVDAWLERIGAGSLPRDTLLDLFEAALLALWARVAEMIGEPTMVAIGERVLVNAARRHPAFIALHVDQQGRIRTAGLRSSLDSVHHMKLVAGIRAVLIDLLTVLGNLTAELLTPELHAELLSVNRAGLPPQTGSGKDAGR